MIDRFKLTPAELKRFRCGPLGPHLDRFASSLSEQGYSGQVGMQKMRLAALLESLAGTKAHRGQETR